MTKKQQQQAEPAEEWDQIEIGDQVKHVKWGVGTVLFRSDTGPNAKAIVVFPEEGQKKLMLRYAKLKKVGSTSLKSVERLKTQVAPPKPAPKPRPPVEEEAEEVEIEAIGGEEELLIGDEEAEVVGFEDEDRELGSHDKKAGTEET